MRGVRLTRQTWLALTAAVAFVILALALAVLPVPYVVYSPGRAYDVLGDDPAGGPVLRIDGATTYPTTGQLRMTTVSVTRADSRISLPQAVLAFWLPAQDALPRRAVYDPGKTSDQVRAEERQMMDTSQQDAVVAALRAAGKPVEELPVVSTVLVAGPANGRLHPGDLITAVDSQPVRLPAQVAERVRRHEVGTDVRLTVLRERRIVNVDVTTAGSFSDASVATIGIEIATGYRYEPRVAFGVNPDIGGPSAGLVFALGIYDEITPSDLLRNRIVAGTGEIDPKGQVRPIGGIQQKIASAQESGAQVFLVPGANCRDLAGFKPAGIEMIKVDTLDSAIRGLESLGTPAAGQVPRC